MEPTEPFIGYEHAEEIKDWLTDEIIDGLQRRLVNIQRAHRTGNIKQLRLESEEGAAAMIELRQRHDLLEQMLDG